ncbi:hypothetical protein CSUI_008134, partial [Cystoisospora suis]
LNRKLSVTSSDTAAWFSLAIVPFWKRRFLPMFLPNPKLETNTA